MKRRSFLRTCLAAVGLGALVGKAALEPSRFILRTKAELMGIEGEIFD